MWERKGVAMLCAIAHAWLAVLGREGPPPILPAPRDPRLLMGTPPHHAAAARRSSGVLRLRGAGGRKARPRPGSVATPVARDLARPPDVTCIDAITAAAAHVPGQPECENTPNRGAAHSVSQMTLEIAALRRRIAAVFAGGENGAATGLSRSMRENLVSGAASLSERLLCLNVTTAEQLALTRQLEGACHESQTHGTGVLLSSTEQTVNTSRREQPERQQPDHTFRQHPCSEAPAADPVPADAKVAWVRKGPRASEGGGGYLDSEIITRERERWREQEKALREALDLAAPLQFERSRVEQALETSVSRVTEVEESLVRLFDILASCETSLSVAPRSPAHNFTQGTADNTSALQRLLPTQSVLLHLLSTQDAPKAMTHSALNTHTWKRMVEVDLISVMDASLACLNTTRQRVDARYVSSSHLQSGATPPPRAEAAAQQVETDEHAENWGKAMAQAEMQLRGLECRLVAVQEVLSAAAPEPRAVPTGQEREQLQILSASAERIVKEAHESVRIASVTVANLTRLDCVLSHVLNLAVERGNGAGGDLGGQGEVQIDALLSRVREESTAITSMQHRLAEIARHGGVMIDELQQFGGKLLLARAEALAARTGSSGDARRVSDILWRVSSTRLQLGQMRRRIMFEADADKRRQLRAWQDCERVAAMDAATAAQIERVRVQLKRQKLAQNETISGVPLQDGCARAQQQVEGQRLTDAGPRARRQETKPSVSWRDRALREENDSLRSREQALCAQAEVAANESAALKQRYAQLLLHLQDARDLLNSTKALIRRETTQQKEAKSLRRQAIETRRRELQQAHAQEHQRSRRVGLLDHQRNLCCELERLRRQLLQQRQRAAHEAHSRAARAAAAALEASIMRQMDEVQTRNRAVQVDLTRSQEACSKAELSLLDVQEKARRAAELRERQIRALRQNIASATERLRVANVSLSDAVEQHQGLKRDTSALQEQLRQFADQFVSLLSQVEEERAAGEAALRGLRQQFEETSLTLTDATERHCDALRAQISIARTDLQHLAKEVEAAAAEEAAVRAEEEKAARLVEDLGNALSAMAKGEDLDSVQRPLQHALQHSAASRVAVEAGEQKVVLMQMEQRKMSLQKQVATAVAHGDQLAAECRQVNERVSADRCERHAQLALSRARHEQEMNMTAASAVAAEEARDRVLALQETVEDLRSRLAEEVEAAEVATHLQEETKRLEALVLSVRAEAARLQVQHEFDHLLSDDAVSLVDDDGVGEEQNVVEPTLPCSDDGGTVEMPLSGESDLIHKLPSAQDEESHCAPAALVPTGAQTLKGDTQASIGTISAATVPESASSAPSPKPAILAAKTTVESPVRQPSTINIEELDSDSVEDKAEAWEGWEWVEGSRNAGPVTENFWGKMADMFRRNKRT